MISNDISRIILGMQQNITINEMLINKDYVKIFLSNDFDDKCLALLILYTINNINIENDNNEENETLKQNFKNIINKLLNKSSLHHYLAQLILQILPILIHYQ